MKKNLIICAASMLFCGMSVQAGGLLTNTNQNAAFLRNMSQNGTIDITSIYANPAGGAFLNDGWHLSLNIQSAFQQRNITTTFPLFQGNVQEPQTTHLYKGKAVAPVIPSFSLAYNKDKWGVSAHFGLIGGGGKCEFDNGIGSFEALYAGQIYSNVATNIANQLATGAAKSYAENAIPQFIAGGMTPEEAQAAVAGPAAAYGKQYAQEHLQESMHSMYNGYSMNKFMKGRSYYFGLQVGGTYKFLDNLSAYLGIRGVYATCNYNGYVQDVAYTVMGKTQSANADLSLNCDQTGFGIQPIIGIDYKLNEHWNFGAKFEAPTKMNLKNTSEMNAYAKALSTAVLPDGTPNPNYNSTLGKFADGQKVREDIPGILGLGAMYSPIESVRISAGFNEYFDKCAKKYNDDQKLIDKNTWDLNVGVDYDVCEHVTVSASYQRTQYGLSDDYMNDLSFNLSNDMIGLGIRIKATKRLNIDLGYMHTFYGDRTVNSNTAVGTKTDVYVRKNDVAAIGFNLSL